MTSDDLLIKAFKERLDNAKICVVAINGEPAGGMCMGSIRIAEQMNKKLTSSLKRKPKTIDKIGEKL